MLNGFCYIVPVLVAMFGQVEETPDSNLSREQMGRPTLGGTQYWTDQLVCHGWRIQRNVVFGQFRLLKPTNRAIQTGTYEECRLAFDTVFKQRDFPPIPSEVLVTLHGLGRTRNSLVKMGEYVSEEGNIGWINFGYSSTRSEIAEHAQALRHVLDELAMLKLEQDARVEAGGDTLGGIEFHFIAHSLGNIVIRQMFSDIERSNASQRPTAWRAGRMVMLGPPNQGSAMATLMKRSVAFNLLAGSSGKDLGAKWETFSEGLIVPSCEFAIIAGGKGDGKGFNPVLKGDDDLIVRVEETKLPGATDYVVIPAVHTYMTYRSDSREMALRFLQEGFLTSADERRSIR